MSLVANLMMPTSVVSVVAGDDGRHASRDLATTQLDWNRSGRRAATSQARSSDVGRCRYGHDVRLITWNMGCSYGPLYKKSQPRTWQQLLAWAPDVALIQETTDPSAWLPEDSFVFTPYAWSVSSGPLIGTAIYSRTGGLRPGPALANADLLGGQVTLVELEIDTANYVIASVHAETRRLDEAKLADREVVGLAASHTTRIYPTDLIRDALTQVTPRRRFIVGGDLNLSIRFDDLYTKGSDFYGNVEWFQRVREAGWWNPHKKFHAGDQRTLFRPGKDEHFQIDHLFVDNRTWKNVSMCDVLDVPFLDELTDHAPLVMEVSDGESFAR